MKRFTIGVDDATAARLDRLKQVKYYNKSQCKMIQDLIIAGLDATNDGMSLKEDCTATRAQP